MLPVSPDDIDYDTKAALISRSFSPQSWPFSLELAGGLFLDDVVACSGCFEVGPLCDYVAHRAHCNQLSLPAIRRHLNKCHPEISLCTTVDVPGDCFITLNSRFCG